MLRASKSRSSRVVTLVLWVVIDASGTCRHSRLLSNQRYIWRKLRSFYFEAAGLRDPALLKVKNSCGEGGGGGEEGDTHVLINYPDCVQM